MLACARGVTTAGRGDEVDVRSGGDSARVDSGGLLWYGAKLWAMVAVSNVTFGKPRRCSRRKEARQESFVCCYLVCLGIPSPLLVQGRRSFWPARGFSVLVKRTAPSRTTLHRLSMRMNDLLLSQLTRPYRTSNRASPCMSLRYGDFSKTSART